jgi:hypothetical protein
MVSVARAARATAQTSTRRQPARLSSRASASAVEPVVSTSSTIATVAGSGTSRSANAPLTLMRRTIAGNAACSSVARTRVARSRTTGSERISPAKRAISPAWL